MRRRWNEIGFEDAARKVLEAYLGVYAVGEADGHAGRVTLPDGVDCTRRGLPQGGAFSNVLANLVLTDGDSADEEPDGTIWVLNKKIYLYDKNGEPDGAAWIEEWITFDGKVVRKGEPKRQEDVLVYEEAIKLRHTNRLRAADRHAPQMPPTGSSR